MAVTIGPAHSVEDLAAVRALFSAYVDGLGIDLGFQGFAEELAGLPGKYAAPSGVVFLARDDDGEALGCVGVRPFDRPGACEVKRLYVRDSGRGRGVGRALAGAAVAFAAAAGYREVLLDTLPSMPGAIALYKTLGFVEIAPYWNNILPGVLYFGKTLDAP